MSGGLDSGLAAKMILDQGIELVGVKFTSPFCNCDQQGRCFAREAASQLGIRLMVVPKGEEYLDVVRHPKHGYGSGLNPCIDCRVFMLRKSWVIAEQAGAQFIVTGEVLGQRPMSQHRHALGTIEREAGLDGLILRPLSARHLPPTRAELDGLVDRDALLAFQGRSRRPQLALAREVGLDVFACPAGGCLLTDRAFAARLRDAFERMETLTWRDVAKLKVGRHFRFGESRIVVGRNEAENRILAATAGRADIRFEVPDCGSPLTLLTGPATGDAIRTAAALTARFSDCPDPLVAVRCSSDGEEQTVEVRPLNPNTIERLRVSAEQAKKGPK
ncbi:MAG: hypothetical protein JSU73_04510 [candidate division WOR-3 bacterium]|nr:MAG: hypothetical protein JSU73_04510 [candidate division WOR-3 bacterium]